MKTHSSPLSIRIIYWTTNFAMLVLGLVFIASIVFNIMLYTDFFGNNLQLHTSFPVKVDFLQKGVLTLGQQQVDVEFVQATSKIHFINTPVSIARKIAPIISLISFFAIFMFSVFRKFILNVKQGLTFNIQNINLLKKLSYILVGFWIFTMIYMRVFYYYIAQNIEIANVRIGNQFSSYVGILFVALIIWVLAHIFATGLKLQEEQDLTV